MADREAQPCGQLVRGRVALLIPDRKAIHVRAVWLIWLEGGSKIELGLHEVTSPRLGFCPDVRKLNRRADPQSCCQVVAQGSCATALLARRGQSFPIDPKK